ncbi:MAG TPA: hypothetical protein VFX70_09575 [Mycobacteriales bacterium]|nr:hypothetical protein [Mycobacteriales bacterium]
MRPDRPDTAGRIKLVCGLVLALILMVLGMVLITKHPGGSAVHARGFGPAAGSLPI